MEWFLLGGAVVLLGVLGWWLFIETEGVYLGRGVVIWLYDLYAKQYDSIKEYDPRYEHALLAYPIMQAVEPQHDPLILDIATGTARLPLTMLTDRDFRGRVVGIDLSRKMLREGAYKLADDLAYVDLLHTSAECLPFPDNSFDVATCLEALEFIDHPEGALREAARVLRPGGLLLTTLRHNIKTMPGKIWSEDKMHEVLTNCGFESITFEAWQEDYTKVWSRKRGESEPVGAKSIEQVLRCPACNEIGFEFVSPKFCCQNCKTTIIIGEDGVLEVFMVQDC